MDFLLCVLAGGMLFGRAKAENFESTVGGRLNAWFSRKRFERMKTKAEKSGFGDEFLSVWQQYFAHLPFACQNMEAYHAYQLAKKQKRQTKV